jgi:hypothetical protein
MQAGKEPRTVAVDLFMYIVHEDPHWDCMYGARYGTLRQR